LITTSTLALNPASTRQLSLVFTACFSSSFHIKCLSSIEHGLHSYITDYPQLSCRYMQHMQQLASIPGWLESLTVNLPKMESSPHLNNDSISISSLIGIPSTPTSGISGFSFLDSAMAFRYTATKVKPRFW